MNLHSVSGETDGRVVESDQMSPRTGCSSASSAADSSSSEAAMTSSSSSAAAAAGGGGGRRFTVRERGLVELQEVRQFLLKGF